MLNGNVNPLILPATITGKAFVDCEATGLVAPSYVISVAVQTTCGFRSQVIIKPSPIWKGFKMDPKAIEIHKMTDEYINEHGYDIQQVASWLNAFANKIPEKSKEGAGVLYSDNPQYEAMWLSQLYANDILKPNIAIRHIKDLLMKTALRKGLTDKKFDAIFKKSFKKYPHTHDALDDLNAIVYMYKTIDKMPIQMSNI